MKYGVESKIYAPEKEEDDTSVVMQGIEDQYKKKARLDLEAEKAAALERIKE